MTKPDSTSPNYRSWRRRQSIADTYRPDARMDKMRKFLDDDPAGFDAMYGAKGHILLGMHETAQEAAGDGPEAA